MNKKRINLVMFMPNLNIGGVQKASVRLANALASENNAQVTLLVSQGGGVVQALVDERVRVVDFKKQRVIESIFPLTQFLNQHDVEILLSIQTNANLTAILAHCLARRKPKLVISERSSFTTRRHESQKVKDGLMYGAVPLFYSKADLITTVSEGVAHDLNKYIKRRKILTLYNPVVDDAFFSQSREPVNDEWLIKHNLPVVLATGRLGKEKDFSTLIRAFDILRQRIEARLIILGEGEDRAALEKLVDELQLNAQVKMPGFAENPYAYMARADVFALSSVREGLPNVLIEAMACRTPVVATDCDFGPREILEGGKYGQLVPLRNPEALADAILRALENPGDLEAAYQRALDFSAERCAKRYLETFEELLSDD